MFYVIYVMNSLCTFRIFMYMAMVWQSCGLSGLESYFSSTSVFSWPLGTVPREPNTINMSVTLIFHSFFSSLARSKKSSNLFFFLWWCCKLFAELSLTNGEKYEASGGNQTHSQLSANRPYLSFFRSRVNRPVLYR